MLIELSKRFGSLQYLAIVLFAAGLWLRSFMEPCVWSLPHPISPLSRLIIAEFGQQLILMTSIGFILLIIQAIYLNAVLIKHKLVPSRTTLGMIIYILLMSQNYRALSLNQVLLASTFVLPALDLILSSASLKNSWFSLFIASALLAIASLFCFPLVFFIPIIFIAVYILRISARTQVFIWICAGIFVPYSAYALYIFLTGNSAVSLIAYIHWILNPSPFWKHIEPPYYIFIGWQIWLLVMSAKYLLQNLSKLDDNYRDNMLLGLYFIILSILSALYLIDESGLSLLPLAIPFTLFLSGFLVLSTQKKWIWFQEMILGCWYLGIFVQNIYLAKC